MLVTWSLFTLWIVLNLVDVAISWLAFQLGAEEIGLVYQVSVSWLSLSINKMVLAVLVGAVLVYFRRCGILALITLGMVGLCIYNGWVLLQQIVGG